MRGWGTVWCGGGFGRVRAKVTCGSKCEVDPLLEVVVRSCDELLELNGMGDESAQSLWF